MIFESYYSSSKSNLYAVTASSGRRLLIECGCTWKQLLKAIDYKLDNIAACIISHEHQDHCKAIEKVLDNGIPVYASHGTFEALGVVHRNAYRLRDRELCHISPEFTVFPFNVVHDCAEPMGFIIHADNEDLLFITDTSHVKQRFATAFSIIAVCCNYDAETLQALVESEKINETYAKRLLESHMEKNVTKDYLRRCCNLDKCTEIWLLHMSGKNIDKENIRAEIEKELMIKTFVAGEK